MKRKNNNIGYLIGIAAVIVIIAIGINIIIGKFSGNKNSTPIATGSNVFNLNTSSEGEAETVSRAIELSYTEEHKLYQAATEKYSYVPIYTGDKPFTEGSLKGSKLSATYGDISFVAYLDGQNPTELSWGKVTMASPSDSYILRKKGDTYAICSGIAGVSYVVSGEDREDVIEAYNTVMVAAVSSE